ncbi:MAG: hypothetical protein LBL33_05860 [Tannerella sp.]|nr:hypothetical protein [Tannerella sp.]
MKIIDTLLINLRYLTKDSSFKEEQECRIIKIERIDSKHISENFEMEDYDLDEKEQIYIDYLDMTKYIDVIYYAPKAFKLDDPNLQQYRDLLRKNRLRIHCIQSQHSFK